MSKEQYTYDPDHMNEISLLYKQSADQVDEAIGNLNKGKDHFLNNYQGQSDNTAPDLFEKIKEHLELLRDCFSQMEVYVTYTKNTMIEQDNKIASTFKE
jgi:uncharacterized protein YukE